MSKVYQSIEDLLGGAVAGDDQSAQSKFTEEQDKIKRKEMERAAQRVAHNYGLPYIDLEGFPISPEALILVKKEEAEKLGTICFYFDGKNIRLGITDPENAEAAEFLKNLAVKNFAQGAVYLISESSFRHALEFYKALPEIKETSRGVMIEEKDLDKFSEKFSSFRDLQEEINKSSLTDIVTVIMAAAIKSNSSDIHIEAEEGDIKARFRIDGVLHDAAVLKKDIWKKIISRLKILAKVKINITDKPQDGRLSILTNKERIDIRASFLPTNYGESVVMRILRSSSVGLAFEDLGLRGEAFLHLKKEVERPNGMIITTGPTGSGKTTTLYAILKKLNNQETKIITIEDPIEYQLEGVNQSQTSEKYTFAHGLRSIVRQDPDIVMVGEIRDLETAEIAIQAALTGHLVLSTIHTNDAAGTVPRFLSMGVKPFLLAPAMNAMIGQRLVRKVCEKCKTEDKPDKEKLDEAARILEKLPEEEKKKIDFKKLKFYKGAGCEACQSLGFKGRIGIYEIMTVNEEIEKNILGGKVSEYDMREIAAKHGMITMIQDGILKALDGITSLDEVFRVAQDK